MLNGFITGKKFNFFLFTYRKSIKTIKRISKDLKHRQKIYLQGLYKMCT
jgi:hypothetical protein